MRLKLNPSKTELIWFDRRAMSCTELLDEHLHVDDACIIQPTEVVRDLGVLLDSQLSLSNHITSVARACFFHLRRIRQTKRCLNEQCLRVLVQALVISRLDYCNSILTGLPDSTLHPLTKVLHTAARLIKNLQRHDHITEPMKQLHWLPIRARISFKIILLMFNIHSGSSPLYMSSLVTPCASTLSRRNL